MMPFHFQPGCDCKLCGSDTHQTSRCPRRPEFQTGAHATCLQAWREIQATENSAALLKANSKWLNASRLDLIRGHLWINWAPNCTKITDKRAVIQGIYSYFAKRLANAPLNMTPDVAVRFSVYDFFIGIYIKNFVATCELNTDTTEVECPICYEKCSDGVKTNCDHTVCGPCMSQIIKKCTAECLTCPMCRANVTKMTSSNKQICNRINTAIEASI